MKRLAISFILVATLLVAGLEVQAQRRPYYRPYRVYPGRPAISVGIGGYYGPRFGHVFYGGPRVNLRMGVMVPPPGAKVRNLPPQTEERAYNGITYYYFDNLYFRERNDGGYEVVEAPLGATLDRLPIGARKERIADQDYYEKDGTYYLKTTDEDGHTIYMITGKDGQLDSFDEEQEPAFAPEDEQPYNDMNVPENEADAAPVTPLPDEDTAPETPSADFQPVKPRVGDRFERLPREIRTITKNGRKVYISANDVRYKEVIVDGQTQYEVVEAD